nr:shikimate dehydrogenase [Patescibacteria group bacterium]
KITADTILCCVVGNPVKHSLSPQLHNAGYEALGLPFVYTAFEVEDIKSALIGMKALGIRGMSITIPHKVTAMRYVDELDPLAEKIGAINTVVNNHGKLKGFNTDCFGAIAALKEHTRLKNKKIVILGAGGAARAIAVGAYSEGAKITILNRDVKKSRELARLVDGEGLPLTSIAKLKEADILIQTTSVGMHPQISESLVPVDLLHKNLIVFDIVYTPLVTRLLKEAKQKQCITVSGYKMLLYQAIKQFELFTDHQAPVAIMETALLKALTKKGTHGRK